MVQEKSLDDATSLVGSVFSTTPIIGEVAAFVKRVGNIFNLL